ncbi:MAG: hypothetical protein NTY82_05220 [Actinobacteria bacterium]|jgi:hypothetical protein|nr:hypothetical protein [Actinomycetota bacterium]
MLNLAGVTSVYDVSEAPEQDIDGNAPDAESPAKLFAVVISRRAR